MNQKNRSHRQYRIIAEAVPFCFGPAATLLSVTRELAAQGAQITYLVGGTSAQLIRLSQPGADIVPCNTLRKSEVAQHKTLLESADMIVSNTNPDFALWTLEWGYKTAVIDTLFWMWDCIPLQLARARPYVIQNFSGISEQKKRFASFKSAPVVGPLIPQQPSPLPLSCRENTLLISFGGIECPLVNENDLYYPALMIEPMLKALPKDKSFERILICGGGELVKRLAPLPSSVEVCCLSLKEHAEILRTCRAAILSLGLTGFFESLHARTPVFFLPPQNYSQVLQLRQYRNLGLADHSLSWDDLDTTENLGPYLPEDIAVARVRDCLYNFAKNIKHQELLTRRLFTFLSDTPAPKTERVESSLNCFGQHGPAKAAEVILNAFQ